LDWKQDKFLTSFEPSYKWHIPIYRYYTGFEYTCPDFSSGSYASLKLALSTDCKLTNLDDKGNHLKWKFLDADYTVKMNQKFAYLNYLQTNDLILIPSLGIDKDDEVVEKKTKECFPDYTGRIHKVRMNDIIAEGGALNCISWTKKEKCT
jgi:agmatine/peptidylarginine deiminase